ncbi:MFS transporter [Kitasatospora purpeofusca]|uniref:MFS transporter n=1 Tax=Kitasatospora purpeofusca TaxID=67352 RepID=UPI002251FB2F|nr:MFS transporter [Kitasatospora purpeofusca]MCX4753392.1 MFS transporter [Kitasatospora purpeofusca]WSR32897.1 MFS transporter [Kitasatospora purpeofusca]
MSTGTTSAITNGATRAPLPPPPVPLRRNWRFQALWAGQAGSTLGLQIIDTAYPLLLLALTGSSTLAAAFGALQIGASVLFGIHGGAVADRYDRRRILIIGDSTRLIACASVPLAMALDRLTVAHSLLVAVVIGATIAYTGPVRLLAVRSVVPPEQLRQALAQDEARMSGAGLIGPPLAGALFGLGRAAPFVGTALTSLLALVVAVLVRFPGRPESQAGDATAADRTGGTEDTGSAKGAALAGYRYLARSALLRPILAVVLLINLAGTAMLLPVMVVLRGQGTSDAGIGLALAGEAVGALVGAVLVRRLHRLAGPGVLLLAVSWLTVPVILAPLLPGGPATVFAGLFLVGLGVPTLRVMIDLLVFQQVEDALRGRVIAATMTMFTIGMPAGMVGSGLLLDHLSPAAALGTVAALLAAGLAPATAGRTLRRATWPDRTAA